MEPESTNRMGVYVHVPVCKGKCIYCSFYSVGGVKSFDWDRYVSAVLSEFSTRKDALRGVTEFTIYIGGGTPSLMPLSSMEKLLNGIRGIIESEVPNAIYPETTIEVNPDDVTEMSALGWKLIGVDRISMGVQSLNDDELRYIGRRHNSQQAVDAYRILRKYFNNISLDLIFGLPKQDLNSLRTTLTRIVELAPEHISAYSLMYEERSALMKMREKGIVEETPENLSVEMFQLINEMLGESGYERYEISNYSKEGRRSKHNSSYWEGVPYIGLGPGAHSYDGNRLRRWNAEDIRGYMSDEKKETPDFEVEQLSADELREERILTRLRVKEGLDLEKFGEEFGEVELNRLRKLSSQYIEDGLMMEENGKLKITDAGLMISDDIMSSLF